MGAPRGAGRASRARDNSGVSSYVRPSIDAPVFRDAAGAVIEYGARWDGPPPEDTYSVETHPERFAPVHAVAEALIAHLDDAYDVTVTDDPATADDMVRPPYWEVRRAVRVEPSDPACASLTFAFTAYPGIVVHAGLLCDLPYPICGCDACDSTWEAEADQLERQVLAVVTGHYRERVTGTTHPWIEHAFTYPDGAASGRSRAGDVPAARLEAARTILGSLTGGWAAWPLAARRA